VTFRIQVCCSDFRTLSVYLDSIASIPLSMEGFLTGTADPLPGGFDAEAVELRRAEKRRRKEDRALRREKKRLKRLPKARIDDEDEEQADVHPESGPRIGAGVTTMTPESMIDPVLVPVSPLVQQEASPSSSPLPSEPVANNSSTIPGPSKLCKALRQPKPIPSSSTFRRPRRKDSQPTDDEFRSRFSVPGAMEAYLASKWLNLQELKRLADAGGSLLAKSTESPRLMGSRAVISYKKGKFSEGETAAIRRHLGLFSLVCFPFG